MNMYEVKKVCESQMSKGSEEQLTRIFFCTYGIPYYF